MGIPSQTVAIPADQLVLGFSFGSGPPDLGKSLFVRPEALTLTLTLALTLALALTLTLTLTLSLTLTLTPTLP